MKTKLSISTIRHLYGNTDAYGTLTHKGAVKELLNRADYLQEYINDLEADIDLMADDTYPSIIQLREDYILSVKELKQLL
jgi:hypothetical protein